VLNVLVPKIVLQGAGVVAIVRELVPTGVPEHVRVDAERHLGGLTEALDKPMEADWADRPTALGNENIDICKIFAPQLA
jgi:hypothetical protein